MATYLRSQTTIPWVGATLPEDQVVWSFAWYATVTDPTGMAALIGPRLNNMVVRLAANNVGQSSAKLTSALDWNNAITQVYDWSEPKPRVPIHTFDHVGALLADSPSYVPLPHEVCLCVSYQAPRVSGGRQARRRGRFYIGPLSYDAGASDIRNPSPGTLAHFLNAVSEELQPGTDPHLAVYSRYTHWGLDVGEHPVKGQPPAEIPGNLGASFVVAEEFWCDNRWDTQRRRGPAPTTRASDTVPFAG